MFQTFEVSARPEQGPPRLAALRGAMAQAGVDAWITPRADRFQGEYVAPCDERLEWLTGFTGSAGYCLATAGRAAVLIDGRYRAQVRTQVALSDFEPVDWPATKPGDWLAAALPRGAVVGFDPWLTTMAEAQALETRLGAAGIALRSLANLIDAIWKDRPDPPAAAFTAWPEALAGETGAQKRARIAAGLAAAGQEAVLLTLPDSVAWLLNIRGSDIERNPVPHAMALLQADGSLTLFAAPGKAQALAAHLGAEVTLAAEADLPAALAELAGPVLLDPKWTPEALARALRGAGVAIAEGADPTLLPKARKNPVEIAGMRAAHLRDGAAMVEFLAWIDAEAPGGQLTEIGVTTRLEAFRAAGNQLLDISFETIAGAGAHAALPHYRVNTESDAPIRPGEILLVDSGAQYIDGTTDITRTMAVGPAPQDAPEANTRVLKGMIALSRARFPKGVTGAHLDSLARQYLWMAGQDYDHGTGHGVGSYLSVHEGPQRFSRLSDVALEPGMILSNEPGFYREGAFGIRIENLLVVREDGPPAGGDPQRQWLVFETITLVPIDRRLIVLSMLDQGERAWLDAYHARVLEEIGPRVAGATLDWLRAACAPL